MAAVAEGRKETQLGDLPEECLALAIALTSPRDASRCAAVSPSFRAAADSDPVWRRFIPNDSRCFLKETTTMLAAPPAKKKEKKKEKDAYLGLCDAATAAAVDGDAGCKVWLDRATGAKCYALSARRLCLPWDDGEFSWKFTHHPRSRFEDVAELVECTCLDIYGRLPAAALTPATTYAAYLVYGSAEGGHRGLSFPDQETAVAVGGQTVARRAVCLWPDDAEARKLRGAGLLPHPHLHRQRGDEEEGGGGRLEMAGRPRLREDAWWEVEMGRLRTTTDTGGREDDGHDQEVVASFEALGWYPKRGLVVHGIEFRPLHYHNHVA